MLQSIHTDKNRIPEPVLLKDLDFDNPFHEGLQYNPPARGVWNIVHTGMLIPEAHQVYVCAQGCLRGVILTAAEMNLMDRMSWVSLREKDMWNGEMESRVVEGVAHIVLQMEPRPKCVLVYLSCMHMFEGCDFRVIADELSERIPGTTFVDCYMTPTMRKSITPDAMMKTSLYAPVKELPKQKNLIGLIGCDRPTDRTSEIFELAEMAGKKIWEINSCETYEEYLELGAASSLISYLPVANVGSKRLADRIHAKWSFIPISYDLNECEKNDWLLSEEILELSINNEIKAYINNKRNRAEAALDAALQTIGDTPIAIDYTATPNILSLALMLTKYGFNVTTLYSDVFPKSEHAAYEELLSLKPEIAIYPTADPAMRFAANKYSKSDDPDIVSEIPNQITVNAEKANPETDNSEANSSETTNSETNSSKTDNSETNSSETTNSEVAKEKKILAIGQKAAYFKNTQFFVNIADGGGMYGLDGIRRMAEELISAYNTPKDTKTVISHKGIGCASCL